MYTIRTLLRIGIVIAVCILYSERKIYGKSWQTPMESNQNARTHTRADVMLHKQGACLFTTLLWMKHSELAIQQPAIRPIKF